MKKSLVVVLLLIIAFATGTPCCGWDDCCTGRVTNESPAQKKGEGTCSPFFSCAACPCFAQVTKPMQFAQPLAHKQEHHAKIISFSRISYASSFWQPPRAC